MAGPRGNCSRLKADWRGGGRRGTSAAAAAAAAGGACAGKATDRFSRAMH